MYKFTTTISIDKEDLEPEELYKAISTKLNQLVNNHLHGLDTFISSGAINDDVGKCSYKVFRFDDHHVAGV